MKIKLPEHDHKLTNILKVLLFSLLMLLPFLDIGTRCGYVLLNKNAYQSYYGETINQYQYENVDNIIVDDRYTFINFNNETQINSSSTIYVEDIDNVSSDLASLTTILTNLNYVRIYYDTALKFQFNFNQNGTATNNYFLANEYNFQFDFTLSSYADIYVNFLPYIHVKEYNDYSYLDNVFDYSIDKMANSPLYNWTTQTGMYTGVNAMTTGLGITTPIFAILITYWMFLTIIYIILDIVLSLFTFMTHIFTKKE